MRGEIVVAKTFTGKPAVLRVWDYDDYAVYLTDERGLKDIEAGEEVVPVGFPRADVFSWEKDIGSTVSDWGALRPWEPKE